ncbi:MAG: transcription antitermination factor NusB [Candidatus Pacebacteria bacterium]|nr:transcription antitermination factor NusB [Candidatus Paceibacterota bacterium]
MSNRHLARTIAMQTLFVWDFDQEKNQTIDSIISESFINFAPNFDDDGYVKETVKGVLDNLKQIDSYITKYATEWPLDQITNVDRNILRIGIYEMLLDDTVPPRVAINEAIEIGKNFGGESSGKFVNGVLGAIYNDMPEDFRQKDKQAEEKRVEEKKKEEEEKKQAMQSDEEALKKD